MPNSDFEGFLSKLVADVRDRAHGVVEGADADFKENVFTEVVAEFLAEAGVIEGAEICHYEGRIGRGNVKVNGYFVTEDTDHLEVFTTIFTDTNSSTNTPRDSVLASAQRAQRFIGACLEGLHQNLEPATDVFSMARSIHDSAPHLERVRVHIMTNGTTTLKQLEPSEVSGVRVHFEVWDGERLFRSMQAGLPRDEITINFEERFGAPLPCLPMPASANDYMAYLAVIPAEILLRLRTDGH